MLSLDFIEDGSDDAPLLRFRGDDSVACEALRAALLGLARSRGDMVALHDLPRIDAVGGCRVTAKAGSRDQGVMPTDGVTSFEWVMTAGGWEDVVGLLEPYCEPRAWEDSRFQWLSRHGDIAVLLSQDGRW